MIDQILTVSQVLPKQKCTSKKRTFQLIADFLSQIIDTSSSEELFDSLSAREKLGSTGVGKGVAIPHCRCEHVKQSVACLITLEQPIDFDAADELPVDILLVLIVPKKCNDEHLQILSNVAQLMDQTEYRNRLRKAQTE